MRGLWVALLLAVPAQADEAGWRALARPGTHAVIIARKPLRQKLAPSHCQ